MEHAPLSKDTYERIANFRYQLRKFLHFAEIAAKNVGVTTQQHQLLLAIKGYPGREYATPGELAERLQITHHACVGLIDRCEQLDLVYRVPNPADGRSIYIRVTEKGMRVLEQLVPLHVEELRQVGLFDAVADTKNVYHLNK